MNGHKKPRRYSDEIHCSHCGKTWDVNDPEPPACKTGHDMFLELRNKLKKGDKS
jgi:hypothetical protein